MIPLKLPAGADQVTVTATATSLPDLIRATSGNAAYHIPRGFNSCVIQAEDGNVRFSVSNVPTASTGTQLGAGNAVEFERIDLSRLLLIRESGDVKLNIQIYDK